MKQATQARRIKARQKNRQYQAVGAKKLAPISPYSIITCVCWLCGACRFRLPGWPARAQQRVARVQARSTRNGQIFHSTGLMRVGRDASIRLLGERVLDVPWLYGA